MQTIYIDLDSQDFRYKYNRQQSEDVIKNGEKCNVVFMAKTPESIENYEKCLALLGNASVENAEVQLELEKEYIDDESEMERLNQLFAKCQEKSLGFDIYFKDGIGTTKFERFVFAKKVADDFVDKLENFKLEDNGEKRSLSVCEKFFVVYNFVANRMYNMSEDFLDESMRFWTGVLSGDKVICSGFASTLKFMCDRVFKPNELVCLEQGCDVWEEGWTEPEGHANNIVWMNDPLYGIKGFSYNDACWDCKAEARSTGFNYFCLPFNSIFGHKTRDFYFEENCFYDDNLNKPREKKSSFKKCMSSDEKVSKMLGLKTWEETEKFVEDKVQELKKGEEQKEENIRASVEEFAEKHDLVELFDKKFVKLPKSALVNFPKYRDFEQYLSEIESLEDVDIEKIVQFVDYFQENHSAFEKFEEKGKQIFGFVPAFTLKGMISNNLVDKNSSNINYFELKEEMLDCEEIRHEEALREAISQNALGALPVKLLENGLRAVAQFNGLNNPLYIEGYIEDKMTARSEYQSLLLENIDAKSKEKQIELSK